MKAHLPVAPLLVAVLGVTACSAVRLEDLSAPRPLPPRSCLVIGFLGGRDSWDDADKGVRQTALALRDQDAGIFVETLENRRRDVALRFVLEALGRDGDGDPDAGEKRQQGTAGSGHRDVGEESERGTASTRRLVVFGQSLGGSATVDFARQLGEAGIDVDLTVQVDSVGVGDGEIPPNVRHALNLYQDSGLVLEGEHPIEAEDPERTRVLGNWRFAYDEPPGSEIDVGDLPFWKALFRVAHAKMDRDPRVWEAVRTMIAGACAGQDLVALAARSPGGVERPIR